jgi:hypothetical protein
VYFSLFMIPIAWFLICLQAMSVAVQKGLCSGVPRVCYSCQRSFPQNDRIYWNRLAFAQGMHRPFHSFTVPPWYTAQKPYRAVDS